MLGFFGLCADGDGVAALRRCSAAAGVSARFVHLVRLVTVPWRPTRQFAVPLVGAFLRMAAMVAWFMIGMKLFLTPD
ncbi:hypothetical protein RW1_060_00220 [Rhodococcus wratislaviensis NBRC 100605]|uniref:Uncharacterized protein n=1 Tax=Rhodococcus wratislaviensis NBRC 100605 TaxID=1219028 RepID=X0PZ28_RHOWR|nr:hypothetical protein RW1_060_00220 [Rhodococcus wratislaviensis NBRC 100605]